MQRLSIPALIGVMIVAGGIGAAIYDFGGPAVLQVQQKVTEVVRGKTPIDRFTDPTYLRREAEFTEWNRRHDTQQKLWDLEQRMSDRMDCLARKEAVQEAWGFFEMCY